jgi:hypothetical protein
MLIADGGGGYGGTNWMATDVTQMWQAVENQDTTAHYRLLTGWQRSYELTLEHLGQVQNFRQSLAEAWPPEKSAASAAYIQRLDTLISNLQATYDAAVANHSAFASATLAISLSRNDVKKIYDEYTANQTKLTEFANKPKTVTKYAAPQKPPVADGRQEQLNNQARTIMFGLSGEIIQARAQIAKPQLYNEGMAIDDKNANDGGPQYVAPPIPPARTFDPNTGTTHPASSGGSHPSTGGGTQTVNPGTDPQPAPAAPVRPPGLVLGGTQPTLSPPTIGPMPPAPIGGGPLPTVISPTPVLPTPALGQLPPGGLRPSVGMRGMPGEGLGRTIIGGVPNGGRSMPPGGVIGGAPGAGLGQPAVGGRPASRVNPVGGVIDSENGAGRPMGGVRGGTSSGHAMTTTGGRNAGRREESEESQRWDPDNPWETVEGVAPVVLPASEQRVDPGPAIGLR